MTLRDWRSRESAGSFCDDERKGDDGYAGHGEENE